MKENFKLGGILLTITLIAGVLIGITNDLTKERILLNSRVSKEDLAIIMPEADSIKEVVINESEGDVSNVEGGDVSEIYEALKGSNIIGHVLKVAVKGFHGPIDFVIGISNEKISGIKVLSHTETPGLGAKIEEDVFRERYSGREIYEEVETVKSKPTFDNEVEGISGATVSSKATTNAVNIAIKFYREKIMGEIVVSKPKEEYQLDLMDERLVNMIPETESLTEEVEGTLPEIIKIYTAYQGTTSKGHVVMVEGEGFNGDILMLVGIDNNRTITAIEVLSHGETENLGALIEEDEYKSKFVGKSINSDFVATFEASTHESEIEAVSGATISSEAVIMAVNNALKYYIEYINQ